MNNILNLIALILRFNGERFYPLYMQIFLCKQIKLNLPLIVYSKTRKNIITSVYKILRHRTVT